VLRLIPGLEQADFARFGVMHRYTFLEAPELLEPTLQFRRPFICSPLAKSQALRDMQPLLQEAGWLAQMQHGWFRVKTRFSCRTPR